MFWISLAVAATVAVVRGHMAQQDYLAAEAQANEQAAMLWEQAQDAAEAARERARANLQTAIGALGEHTLSEGQVTWGTGTYDDWYNATRAEYDAKVEDGLEQSWGEYLRSEQISELGEYGIARAELELTVDIARRQFDLAEEGLDKARQFVDRNWGLKASEAVRAHQQHLSMAGASGMRSGTAHETAQEYQIARMEGLNLWREEQLYNIQGKRKELELEREKLDFMEESGLAKLDAFLASSRTGFEFDMGDIHRKLGDMRESLDFDLSQFNDEAYKRASWAGFFGGLQQGFELTVGVGDVTGAF